MNLDGKTAVVTGGAKRVGSIIAQTLAEAGCNIVIHHNKSDPSGTCEKMNQFGVECTSIRADLRNPEDYAKFDTLKKVDILVNSASVFHRDNFYNVTLEDWNKSLEVNLTAPFLMMKRIVPLMKGDDALVVNMVDGAGLRPWVNYLAHGVSKAALIHLTEITARTLAPKIRVNAVVPGPVLKTEGMDNAVWERVYGKTSLKRPGDPLHIASAVKFLAENDYITGEVLRVDGGEYLENR